MEPKKKLKHIPMWQFIKNLGALEKVLFGFLFAALLSAATWMVLAANDPAQWVMERGEVTDGHLQEVELRSYTYNFRTMTTEVGAWKEDLTYYSSIMSPKDWLVLLFISMQVLGWAFLLASMSYLKQFMAYGFFLAFTILVVVANSMHADNAIITWGSNIGLALLLLGTLYALQQGWLKLGFGLRVALYFLLAAAPFALIYFKDGWVKLHGATVGMLPVMMIFLVVYLVFVSNDLSNMLFFLGSNAKKKSLRLGFPLLMAVFMVLTAIEFLLVQKQMGWNMLSEGDDISLRPIHLLALAGIVSVFAKQNLQPRLKEHINNRSLSMGILAFGLISFSFLAYLVSMGEFLFLHMVERLAALLFILTGIFHFFYIAYNFGPLIRAKLNYYYLTMLPRRLMYFFVLMLSVGGTFALDASQQGKSMKLYYATIYNELGDNAMLRGKNAEAKLHYSTAVKEARGSVKGNYNLAMLEISTEGNLPSAREHFRQASSFIPFSSAYINWSNLEQSSMMPHIALQVLNEGAIVVQDPYLYSNLAKASLDIDQPDSAIIALKQALKLQPDNSAHYGMLGRIYMEYDKPEEAVKFLQAGLEVKEPHPLTITNALFFNLENGHKIEIDEKLLERPEFGAKWELRYNYALDKYKSGDLEGAKRVLTHGRSEVDLVNDSLPAVAFRPDSLLLDGMLLLESGEIAKAISRMEYIDINFPNFKPYTNHFLGTAFFGMGVPEMASAFFRKSVSNGRQSDLLQEAQMEFDRGNLDYAFLQLNLVRVADPGMVDAANNEMAKVQLANGDFFFATLGFDIQSLTEADWMQVGIAAGKRGNKAAALEAFRRIIERDPKAVAPYIEMAKISLNLGDSLALENLEPALEMEPDNFEARMVEAEIWLGRGKVAKAEAALAPFQSSKTQLRSMRILNAAITAAKGDTSKAIAGYEQLLKENPIDPATILPLSRLYLKKEMEFKGQNTMMEAIAINPENPEFWYMAALFERKLNRPEEAGINAIEAMKRSASLEWSKKTAVEFSAEIEAWKALHPGENE